MNLAIFWTYYGFLTVAHAVLLGHCMRRVSKKKSLEWYVYPLCAACGTFWPFWTLIVLLNAYVRAWHQLFGVEEADENG